MGGIDLYASSLVTAAPWISASVRHGCQARSLTLVGGWVADGGSGGSGVTGQCRHPVRLHGI